MQRSRNIRFAEAPEWQKVESALADAARAFENLKRAYYVVSRTNGERLYNWYRKHPHEPTGKFNGKLSVAINKIIDEIAEINDYQDSAIYCLKQLKKGFQ